MDINERLLKSINKITYTNFTEPISEEDAYSIIEELVDEYENLKEEFEDYKRDVEDNYRPIPVSEQYGISEREFY